MSKVIIHESGMDFGPYATADCLHLEKSEAYGHCPEGVKMAEFALVRKERILFVEAKSSSPRPETQPNFDDFLAEIREKMENALLMLLGMRIGRHRDVALPRNVDKANLATIGFMFVLVINGHKEEWLSDLNDALNNAVRGIAGAFPMKFSPMVNAWASPFGSCCSS